MGNQLTWGQLNGVVVYWGNRYQRERSLTIELTIIESVNGVMMIYDDNDDHSDAIDKQSIHGWLRFTVSGTRIFNHYPPRSQVKNL